MNRGSQGKNAGGRPNAVAAHLGEIVATFGTYRGIGGTTVKGMEWLAQC